MEIENEKDGNKKVSGDELIILDGENGDGEHKRMHSEETESDIIHSEETHSRSSSSSSSSSSSLSSSYLSPPKDLPEESSSSEIISPAVVFSPPVQVMEREDKGSYDPNRIPSSVFERSKSNIAAEWSCTSNESLFSIHLGHNSFTVYGGEGDLYKSGELLAYSPSLPMPPPPGSEPKPVKESKILVVDSDKEEEEVVLVEDAHTSSSEEEEEQDKRDSNHHQYEKEQHPAVSWKTPTTSYRSNRSSNSAHSFSFPILAGAASGSTKETEERKKLTKQSTQDLQKPADAATNQKQSTMCSRWFSSFPTCPSWCCSSCSCT